MKKGVIPRNMTHSTHELTVVYTVNYTYHIPTLATILNVVLALTLSIMSESESDGDGFGPGVATVTSTWDVLPVLDTANGNISAVSSDTGVPLDQMVSTTDIWMSLVHESNLSMPLRIPSIEQSSYGWERTLFRSIDITPMPYARQVQLPLLSPVVHTPTVVIPSHTVHDHEHAWNTVARRVRNINAVHTAEATRAFAISKWKLIIQSSPKHSEVGRLLQRQIWDLFDDAQLLQTLEDIFSTKSTATLLKRGNSMMKYILWCAHKKLQALPISEQTVYAYLYDAAHKSPTGPTAFKEALNFSAGLIGLDGAASAANSSRVIGYCKRRYLQKAPLKQSRTLSVAQVIHLENMVVSDDAHEYDLPDRVMAGHALYTLFARARWTDSLFPTKWNLDEDEEGGGFYQADTLISKTSTTAEKKTRFLPLTGPLKGIASNTWFQTWQELRVQANLPMPNGRSPIMCSVRLDGSFSSNKLSTTDAGAWLRDLLRIGEFTDEQITGISSHSLKSTTLSWCAKYGLDLEVRQALGYHVTAASTSAAHYSRDELAGPLRKLEEVLQAIRDGLFQPDQTRSGYMRPVPKAAVNPLTRPRNSTERGSLEIREESSDSSSSDSSSSSGEESGLEVVAREVSKMRPPDVVLSKRRRLIRSNHMLFLHTRWKTIHIQKDESDPRLKCGRAISVMYKPFRDTPNFQYHKCQDCFRNQGSLDTAEPETDDLND
jgi:hypothetical protein